MISGWGVTLLRVTRWGTLNIHTYTYIYIYIHVCTHTRVSPSKAEGLRSSPPPQPAILPVCLLLLMLFLFIVIMIVVIIIISSSCSGTDDLPACPRVWQAHWPGGGPPAPLPSMHPCIHASTHPCIHASMHPCIHASSQPASIPHSLGERKGAHRRCKRVCALFKRESSAFLRAPPCNPPPSPSPVFALHPLIVRTTRSVCHGPRGSAGLRATARPAGPRPLEDRAPGPPGQQTLLWGRPHGGAGPGPRPYRLAASAFRRPRRAPRGQPVARRGGRRLYGRTLSGAARGAPLRESARGQPPRPGSDAERERANAALGDCPGSGWARPRRSQAGHGSLLHLPATRQHPASSVGAGGRPVLAAARMQSPIHRVRAMARACGSITRRSKHHVGKR